LTRNLGSLAERSSAANKTFCGERPVYVNSGRLSVNVSSPRKRMAASEAGMSMVEKDLIIYLGISARSGVGYRR
jgi:hypothetical protein